MTDQIRIGDSEREQAVSALSEHYLAGRLTKEEYDERTAVAFKARTTAELHPLFWDLPNVQQKQAVVPTRPSPSRGRRRHFPVFPLAMLFIAVLVFTPAHLPWWGWLLFFWMWCSGMFAAMTHRFMRRR